MEQNDKVLEIEERRKKLQMINSEDPIYEW